MSAGPLPDPQTESLVAAALAGERRALARLISLVENNPALRPSILRRIYPSTGRARLLGVTGPPGVGKSTLVNRLVGAFRAMGQQVAVVAVDPTSPFSGGAILGDRVRMQERAADPGVFIRSLATRGHLGGLSLATRDVVRLMDAAGFDTVIIETVGTGQSEVDIMDLAHTVLVVSAPGAGDDIQAQKAGILEIADVLVVNKADRDGTDQLIAQLQLMLDMAPAAEGSWRPPIVRAVASEGKGIEQIVAACSDHGNWLSQGDRMAERLTRRAGRELFDLVAQLSAATARELAENDGTWARLVAGLAARQLDPYAAAAVVLEIAARAAGPRH